MPLFRAFIASSIGQKSIMAATGALLCCFVLGHLLGNTTIFAGREAFLRYAGHIHSLGIILHTIEVVLLAIFFLHVTTGTVLVLGSLQARPVRYAVSATQGGRTLGSRTMPYTGVAILLFIAVHLANFHFTDRAIPIADLVRNHLHHPGLAIFYLAGFACLGLHISHGLWSLMQTLGANHPPLNGTLRGAAILFAVVVSGTFSLIPLLAMAATTFLR